MPRTRRRATRPSRAAPPLEPRESTPPPPAPSEVTAAPAAKDACARFEIDGLCYELDRPPRPRGRRSVATVRLAEHPDDPGFRDRVDLFGFKSRHSFARRVADAFGRQAGDVLGHLALILDSVERAHADVPTPRAEELTPERCAAAVQLLCQPNLLERAAAAMESLGHVGEEQVKRLCYLVATSRLMDRPLSALLLAPSATGKSAVLDAVAALMPAEQVVPLARLTAYSLYYQGRDALRNKLVVVDEYEGTADADHPLRVLQSKGELRQSVTIKGRAEEFLVRGPVAVMSGTTATKLDVQNTSRCLELSLDDGVDQTRRIQAAQARFWSGAGCATPNVQVWQDAQRLLEPLGVVLPFAERLRFPARTTADRRGSAKLLGLVVAHALLHQRRRLRDRQGRVVAEASDYAGVYELVRPAADLELDGLPPRAARAYRALVEAGEPATRRQIAAKLSWNYVTAARALDDLLGQELARVVETCTPRRYLAVEHGVLGGGTVLTPPEELT